MTPFSQVVKIWFRGTISLGEIHGPWNFLLQHQSYVHPKFVLENDKASLMGCDQEKAWFCISDKNVFETSKAPFLHFAQLLWAQKLVIMPWSSVYRLGDAVGDPKGKTVTFLDTLGKH